MKYQIMWYDPSGDEIVERHDVKGSLRAVTQQVKTRLQQTVGDDWRFLTYSEDAVQYARKRTSKMICAISKLDPPFVLFSVNQVIDVLRTLPPDTQFHLVRETAYECKGMISIFIYNETAHRDYEEQSLESFIASAFEDHDYYADDEGAK